MSNKVNENNFSIYDNKINYFKNILNKQENDPFCKILCRNDISLGLLDEVEVKDINNISLGFFELEEIFEYILDNYPFIVTVPEEYKDLLLGKGIMKPVSPNDDKIICGFKGTMGRKPFISKSNNEKRYIVKINDNIKKNIYPYLNTGKNKSFRGVGFLPLNILSTLKIGVDYEVLGLFTGSEIDGLSGSIDGLNSYKDLITNKVNDTINTKSCKGFCGPNASIENCGRVGGCKNSKDYDDGLDIKFTI